MRLLPLALLIGCNGVSGTIDGEEVPTYSGFYIEQDGYFGSDGLLVVYLTGAEGGCETMAAFMEDMDDADDAEEQVDTWKEYLPEEFWEVQIWIRIDDPDDELAGTELDGVDWNGDLDDDEEALVWSRRFTDYPTENSFTWWGWLTGDATDYYESYTSDGGEGKISAYSPGEHLRGGFTADMVDGDGDEEGEVTVSFSADRCRDVEDQVF